jgi:hypothetical protein
VLPVPAPRASGHAQPLTHGPEKCMSSILTRKLTHHTSVMSDRPTRRFAATAAAATSVVGSATGSRSYHGWGIRVARGHLTCIFVGVWWGFTSESLGCGGGGCRSGAQRGAGTTRGWCVRGWEVSGITPRTLVCHARALVCHVTSGGGTRSGDIPDSIGDRFLAIPAGTSNQSRVFLGLGWR